MNNVLKTFVLLLIVCSCSLHSVYAQKNDKEKFRDIFSDLPFDDPASNSKLNAGESTFDKIRDNIFVRPVLNKRRCFLGEPILLTINLWTRLQSTSAVTKRPYLTGFISTPIRSDETPASVKVKNKTFRVFRILQWQLIPTMAGKLNVDKITLEHTVSYKDDAGATYTYKGKTESDSISIYIDSLPVKQKPKNFSGLTGNFSLTVFPVNDNLPVNKTNSLQIEISGTGNYIQALLPLVSWPDSIEIFPVKERTEVISDSFPFSGRKIFEIPFIPQKVGEFQLPVISLSFFDAAAHKYSVINSKPVILHVAAPEKKEVDNGIGIINTNEQKFQKKYWWYAGAAIIAILIIICMRLLYLKSKRSSAKKMEMAHVKEEKNIQNKKREDEFTGELDRLMSYNESKEFILAYKNLMTEYLQAKTGTSVHSEDEIYKKIQLKDNVLAARVWDIYKDCNTLLYSSQRLSSEEKTTMIDALDEIHQRVNAIWE